MNDASELFDDRCLDFIHVEGPHLEDLLLHKLLLRSSSTDCLLPMLCVSEAEPAFCVSPWNQYPGPPGPKYHPTTMSTAISIQLIAIVRWSNANLSYSSKASNSPEASLSALRDTGR
eukprot:gnl/TRDRNA2_/TRDRNA2_138331_c0_seq1.p1 gnl/TRDRNA2_/TRDRNA2_138331_c0~~gnl/TRDRNA2_/TRDRNA2_138331_c0_seq1.p1  ORF type:complete len:117 (+),score=2.80 gnl/TRDRNA2_/TRDRNA2_138331_c0_seq1:170-520(+)